MPSLGLLQSKTLPGSGRKLFDLTINNVAPIAEEGIKQIKAFYRIEAQIWGCPPTNVLLHGARKHGRTCKPLSNG